MDNREKLLQFLKSQRLIVIASKGDDIWISNIYYGIDDNFKFYYISSEVAKHSKHILNSPKVAFSVAWYNNNNHEDRKAIQGKGKCKIAENDEEINKGVELHNKNFPEFAKRITVDWVKSKENNSHVWIIEPEFIKFWNDELYGDDEIEEFRF